MITPAFLKGLRCPCCMTSLTLEGDAPEGHVSYGVLRCACYRYPIVDGIPVLAQMSEPFDAKDPIVAKLDAGDQNGALRTAIEVGTPVSAQRKRGEIQRIARLASRVSSRLGALMNDVGERLQPGASETTIAATNFVQAVRGLRPEIYADYLIHRQANPSFLAAVPVLLGLLESLEKRPGAPILDLACGVGHATFLMRALAPETPVVAVDHDFANIYLGKRFMAPDATWVCLDSELPLPFVDQAFGAVFCLDSFHYVRSKVALIRELDRVLDSRGLWAFPHLHNALVANISPGVPLSPEGWAHVFAPAQPRLFDEAKLLDEYARRGSIDLSSAPPAEKLASAPVLSMAGEREPGALLRRRDRLFARLMRGRQRLFKNPIYAATPRGERTQLEVRWPSPVFAEECGAVTRILPATIEVDTALLMSLERGEVPQGREDEVATLARTFVVVALPDAYGV